jgi:hypothetical protein
MTGLIAFDSPIVLNTMREKNWVEEKENKENEEKRE